mmetsp:Transcript_4381/g.6040  ORF Transcript_4381/g.6040 Transcript_4381/m.6040 type:complete len:178 (+) Transcript_4381:96-629(+)
MAYNPDNIFKKIVDGIIPCYKIFETDHSIAILDAFPCAKGHSLLIPKTGYTTLSDMPPEEAAAVLKDLPRLVQAVEKVTGADGVNVLQNNGKAAGQEIFHVHFHVVPRFKDDKLVKLPSSSKSMIEKEEAEALLAIFASAVVAANPTQKPLLQKFAVLSLAVAVGAVAGSLVTKFLK